MHLISHANEMLSTDDVHHEGDVDKPRPGRDVEPAPAKAGVKSDTHRDG